MSKPEDTNVWITFDGGRWFKFDFGVRGGRSYYIYSSGSGEEVDCLRDLTLRHVEALKEWFSKLPQRTRQQEDVEKLSALGVAGLPPADGHRWILDIASRIERATGYPED